MHKVPGAGAPENHYQNVHNLQLTRDILVQNTKILKVESDLNDVMITEAFLFQTKRSVMNQ